MTPTPLWKNSFTLSPRDRSSSIAVRYSADIPDAPKAAVLAYAFYDEFNKRLRPLGSFKSAKWSGPYEYIDAVSDHDNKISMQLECPSKAARLDLKIYPWSKRANFNIIGEPKVEFDNKIVESDFLDSSGTQLAVPAEDLRLRYTVTPGMKYAIIWDVRTSGKCQALLTFHYYDEQGNPKLPGTDFGIHPKYGAYEYVVDSHGNPIVRSTFRVPDGVTRLEIIGVPWKHEGASVQKRPQLVALDAEEGRLSDSMVLQTLRSIPLEEPVVVVSTTAGPISPSNNLLLRSNRLAYEYAKAGWNVVFFPFSRLGPNDPETLTENLHQFDRSRLRLVMDELLDRKGQNNVLLCSSFTDVNMVGLIDQCHHHGWRVVYEVRDDMEEFNRVGYSKWYDSNLETRFATRADAVVAVSPRLRDKISAMTGRNDVGIVPNGTPDELVNSARALRSPSVRQERQGYSKIGYIGHLTASWFDWDWLIQSANELPTVEFEIIGHGLPNGMRLPRNVRYLGSMSHSECLPYTRTWTAGLIPFKISRLTYGVDPNKAYEYVAMGLRTVSAPMGQISNMPGAIVYRNQPELTKAIEWAVRHPLSDTEMAEFENYLKTASWSHRSHEMLAVLSGRNK